MPDLFDFVGEGPLDIGAGSGNEVITVQERISELGRSHRRLVLRDQKRQGLTSLFAGLFPTSILAEIDVREADSLGLAVTFTILIEPGLKLRIRRLRGHFQREEFHLLHQPAPDDRVILIEAKRHRLAHPRPNFSPFRMKLRG